MLNIKIYCDESCHLKNDVSDVMSIGAISCQSAYLYDIKMSLRKIKKESGFDKRELKWSKVSKNYVDMYKKIIDYFYNSKVLSFRVIVIANKKSLKFSDNEEYDIWYYKMYYLLLSYLLLHSNNSFEIFIDRKDSNGKQKIERLRNILSNSIYDFNHERLKKLVEVDSQCSDLIQLADFFTGLITYYKRGLHLKDHADIAKKQLVEYASKKFNFKQTSSFSESKFNIFYWTGKGSALNV